MASTNKTKNYQLNQWLGSDYMKRDDLNSDNELIDAALKYNADSLSAEAAARSAGDSVLRDLVSSEAAARQTADEEINSIIKSGVTMSPDIGLGMNSVIRRSDGMTSIPKFTMQGKSYVNLLGKDGNCEDVSKWYSYQSTISLDTANKVFGSNCIKITLTATAGNMNKALSNYNFDTTKHYLISAYVDKGNATNITLVKDNTGGGTYKFVTSTATVPTRVAIKVQPSENHSGNYLQLSVAGSSGQYGYADGIMINEITATEYASLTTDQLMEKYPYVDSYACVQNPYIEVRHDNLVRNGNGEEGVAWWVPFDPSTGTLSIENGKFKFVTTTYNNIANVVNVKPNTNYYFSANKSGTNSNVQVVNMAETIALSTGGTFNTGSNTQVKVRMTNAGANTCYYDSFMLIEGTTAPTSYKPCRIERCVIEGKFTSGDSVTYENGKVSGLLNWKHETLYGKDYDWQCTADYAGSKTIRLSSAGWGARSTVSFGDGNVKTVKYNGKMIPDLGVDGASDRAYINGAGSFYDISVSDTDSGWAETVNPNADEVKAFMNGWRAVANNGTRYIAWVNIMDSSVPAGTVKTLAVGTNAAGQKVINITTGEGNTKFAVGDNVYIFGYGWDTLTAVSANSITTTNNLYTPVNAKTQIMKADNGSTNVALLTWCKNNIAPGYEGYQLHYKLANPEPIADANVHVHGDIPKLDNGDNYVYVDSGMVLGEVANPYLVAGIAAVINNTSLPSSVLGNQTEYINAVYKNTIPENVWTHYTGLNNTYGNDRLGCDPTNYDPNAIYTVDYQILKTMHTTSTTITMQYQQDVLNAVADLADGLNSRQKADSALDNLVDLSVYEEYKIPITAIIPWMHYNNSISADLSISFKARKKAIPIVELGNDFVMYAGTGTASSTITTLVKTTVVYVNKDNCTIRFFIDNATVISNIKTCGCAVGGTFKFDCRGRV